MPDRIIAGAPASLKAEEQTVPLWLSVTLDQDYRNLGAFPGLRLAAAKRSGASLLFRVPLDFAKEVLSHGRERMQELGTGRGLYQSYRAMVAKLAQALDDAEGVADDPGREAWEQQQAEEFARLREGDLVTDGKNHTGKVIGGLRTYQVADEDGPYRNKKGERLSYQTGYLVRWGHNEDHVFVAPGLLCGPKGETTHLRLVRSN